MAYGFSRSTENTSILKRCGVMLLALLFCVCFLPSVGADEKEVYIPVSGIDLNHNGSVRVLVKDADGNLVSGGTLQMYRVATITDTEEGRQTQTVTEAFAGWDGTAEDLLSDQSCAESLAYYVEKNSTESIASAENTEGSVTFTDIAPGVYLVRQSVEAEGYETMLPFLVFLPVLEDGNIVYDIEAQPKPVAMRPPGSVEICAEKTVKVVSGTAPKGTVFSFVMTAKNPDTPLPRNGDAVYDLSAGSMTVSRTDAGQVRFGTLPLTLADAGKIYEYEIREVRGSAAHFSYDSTVYKLVVSVTASGDGGSIIVSETITDGAGNKVDEIAFRNHYDGGDTPEIPRTGQLWWPVLAMLPAGALLIVVGFAIRRREDEPEEDLI